LNPIVKASAERLTVGSFALRDLHSASEGFRYKRVRDAIRGWSMPGGWGEYTLEPGYIDLLSWRGPRPELHSRDVPELPLGQIVTPGLMRKFALVERKMDKRKKQERV
jgi:hypothetical protein